MTRFDSFWTRPELDLVVSPDGKTVAYLGEGKGPPEGGLVTFKIFLQRLDDPKAKFENLEVKAHHHLEAGKEFDQLYVADVAGGKPVRVSQELNGAIGLHYCWSPDSKRVAYVWHNQQRDENETFLMVVNADGTQARVLTSQRSTSGLASFGWPNWR